MAQQHVSFDFDAWCVLAQEDPQAFFAARHDLIEAFIASVPEIHRPGLRELQTLIDGTRVEAGTPFKAVQKIMDMLGEHVRLMQAQLEQLREESTRLSAHASRLRG